MNCKNKIQSILSLFFLVIYFFTTRSFVSATDVTVSARVPDIEAPSVPILIAPADGSLLNDNTPSFQWYESFDNVALSYYVLGLNGDIVYDNIPLIETENSDYVLEYDELNEIYTLTPKNSLSDQSYNWNIVAVDYANLSSSSDIWDFTIDTLAPDFILTKIGDTDVSISASNVGSVPTEPIIIFKDDATANEPILIAYGEANSQVQLTVTIPDDATQNFTTQIDTNSYYELKLGILPRDKDIRLDFVIIDQVGHVSVLEEVFFRIELQYWPTTTPTLTPTVTPSIIPSQSVSPTLTVSPSLGPTLTSTPSVSLSPSLSPSPTISPSPVPTGFIPIIPPKEIIHEFGDELIEVLPESVADQIRAFLKSEFWKNLSLMIALLLLGLFYLFAFLMLLSKFMVKLSFSLAKKILILLFPPFLKAKKHLVFEYGETLASPLVLVELIDQNNNVLDFTITNLQGNFDHLNPPSSIAWRLQVKDSNFYYPIGDQKPSQLNFWQFYQNQFFNQDNYQDQPILIPTVRATGQVKLPFLERLRIFILYLLNYPAWFLAFCLLLSLAFALRYASSFNGLALLFYTSILFLKLFELIKKQNTFTLLVNLIDGQKFYGNLIVSLFGKDNGLAHSLIVPTEFSKSLPIKHSFIKASMTVFARKIALTNNQVIVPSQEVVFSEENQKISISLKKLSQQN